MGKREKMAADQTLSTTVSAPQTATSPPVSLRESLASLTRPRCPRCKKRGMVCRYAAPESYQEPSPRFYECSCCSARYFRTFMGPWQDASGAEFNVCYAGGPVTSGP
jgi:DNA-directed RNA polymerase subunit M/transcription elongation factor TFIIS